MTLRVVGAGLGRTGTTSLKVALEQLLGAPCYHMVEVFAHPEHAYLWRDAALGTLPNWSAIFEGYVATVDWPGAAFWEEIAADNPESIILLSTRDPEAWWESASQTIFAPREGGPPVPGFKEMLDAIFDSKRFTRDRHTKEAAIARFVEHNQRVRDTAPKDRLVEWTATDGWAPLCKALNVPIPKMPFPKANTREDWFERAAKNKPPGKP